MKRRSWRNKLKKKADHSMFKFQGQLFYCNDEIIHQVEKEINHPLAQIGMLGGVYGINVMKISRTQMMNMLNHKRLSYTKI